MALDAPYITADDLRDYLTVTKERPTETVELESAVDSISREIERHCGRQFNQAGTTSARMYVPDSATWTYVDDFHTTTGLVVEVDLAGNDTWTTWAADDYQLEPLNGIVEGQSGWPYYKLRALSRSFPVCRSGRATVRVTADWGWAAVPDPVVQAAKILAAETFTLRTAPLGVAGVDDYGIVRVRDSRMAAAKLSKYVKRRLLVG